MATICASTTDGALTMFGKIAVFLSGSHAVRTTMNGASVSFTAPNDLGSVGVGSSKVFQLQINDINDNPMPQGTKVALANSVNITPLDVLPGVVPNIAPHSNAGDDKGGNTVSGPQGSFHTFAVAAPPLCPESKQASFYVVVTTPGGTATTMPFKLQITCN